VSECATIRRDLLLNGVLAWPTLSNRPRVAGLRALGMRIGTGVYVAPCCWFGGTDVAIGSGTYLQYRCSSTMRGRCGSGGFARSRWERCC